MTAVSRKGMRRCFLSDQIGLTLYTSRAFQNERRSVDVHSHVIAYKGQFSCSFLTFQLTENA
jgi:hypothetical protein